jgi:DNA polymerase IV
MVTEPAMEDAPLRKVIHIDMDAFFASVEQRDHPDLKGKPVAVGGQGPRGVVAAASYEAREFGVRSAMPSARARRLCPNLIFVPPRFEVYRQVSGLIREIFLSWTPLVQPLSLDEAYLDVTHNLRGEPSATRIAEAIRAEIVARTQLTASAGVSYNKFLAKIASDMNKPNGQYVIPPDAGPAFVAGLPVRKFHGVGPATTAKMERFGILTGQDLRNRSLEFLKAKFGKAGEYYYWAARGIDRRPVNPHQERKSIGSETTFRTDLTSYAQCMAELEPLIETVGRHCEKRDLAGRTVTLKLRYADFTTVTRSRTLNAAVSHPSQIAEVVGLLLTTLMPLRQGVRLLGVTISGFKGRETAAPDGQAALFEDPLVDPAPAIAAVNPLSL